MVIEDSVINTTNCHLGRNNRLCVRGKCTGAAPRSHGGERNNQFVFSGGKDRSAAVAGDSIEEVVEDLVVEVKKGLVDGLLTIGGASNRYHGAL